MKFVHAADLHLDSPLSGLERYEGAPVEQIRRATRRALENLVQLCLEEDAALLLLAGDLFDGDWRDYSTGLFFASQMAKLRQAGVEVVWIRGNHDAACKLTKHLELPGVRELPYARADSFVFDDLGVAVHGQGFATQAVTSDLSAAYPDAIPGLLNIGLLHTAVEGAEGHASYAPCRLEALVNKGYDYWALGHVHRRTVLHRDPWVVFAGNLQGRHARERGPKGATLVTTEAGRVLSVEPKALDVVRWDLCEVDAASAGSIDDVLDRVSSALQASAERADGLLVAARVILTGNTRAHAALDREREQFIQQVRSSAMYLADGTVWVEKVLLQTRGEIDIVALRQRDDAAGQLARSLDALRNSPPEIDALLSELVDVRQKLPVELRRGADALRLDEPETVRRLLEDVEQMLLPRLLSVEDA